MHSQYWAYVPACNAYAGDIKHSMKRALMLEDLLAHACQSYQMVCQRCWHRDVEVLLL